MGLAPPGAGSLSDLSPLRLYYLAASAEQTGLLTFQLVDRTIKVQFRKGNPEHVSSTHPEDSIGEFFRAQKILTNEQLALAEAALSKFGNDLVGALFGLGLLNPGNAFANLAEQALSVLLKAFLAETGSFTYQDTGFTQLKVQPLGNRWAVLTDAVRRMPLPEIKRRLKNQLDLPFATSAGQVQLKDLPLTPREARAASHLNGAHPLGHLARTFPQDSDNLHRLVFMFRHLELISLPDGAPSAPEPPTVVAAAPETESRVAAQGNSQPSAAVARQGISQAAGAARQDNSPPAASPARAPVRAAGTGPPMLTPSRGTTVAVSPPTLTPSRGAAVAPKIDPAPRTPPSLTPSGRRAVPPVKAQPEPGTAAPPLSAAASAEVEQLRATVKKMKEDNYFQVLSISPNADANAVKQAYIKLAKLYHPDTHQAAASSEIAKLKEEIFTLIGQAQRVLSNDVSRTNYREIIEGEEGGGEMLPLAQVLVAEETFERGRNLVKAKRFPEAVKMLDEAIGGSADVAEFYAWRGYAKFFSVEDKKRAQLEATKDLQTAIQKSQHCASAYYFLGQVAKLTGDNKTALTHFRKAVEIKPDHIDAKREVRLLTKK
jgi:curved DNA-binding protein CbpA